VIVLLRDKIGRDDYIGTTFINLSEISAPGDNGKKMYSYFIYISFLVVGFLPTFGPVFVNIYGSPREFTDLPDKYEYLNMGKVCHHQN